MKTIKLSKDMVAIVDEEDFEMVNKFKWYIHPAKHTSYAMAVVSITQRRIYMHRLILNVLNDNTFHVDHIDRNGLNNVKGNLRLVTPSQNRANSIASGKSRYKGVCWDKNNKKWKVQINGRHLGLYSCEKEGALVYNEAAKKAFGEFAKLNDVK